MLKNIYFRLGLISAISAISLLIFLPRIPVKINNNFLKFDSYIGGYQFSLFEGQKNFDWSNFRLGLDLKGGVRIVLKANMEGIDQGEYDKAITSALEVMERRVNFLGVSEPFITSVKTGDEYRILVEIPGLDDVKTAVDLIGQTAQLKFKVLNDEFEWTEEKFQEAYFNPEVWVDTALSGADLKGAEVLVGQGQQAALDNSPQIRLHFTEEGLVKFSEIALKNVNKPVAIFLDEDNVPLSMAVVDESLANGVSSDPVINGNFSYPQAQNLSLQIRAGALPISIELLQQEVIGATLGRQSVNKSLFAGIVGLAMVLLFMIYMYKKLGVLACISLIIYTIIVLAIFKIIPVVLTMPGIAGFILSIGMASDANILIFERIKEEKGWGRPMDLAIKNGFDRAWTSIRDSNISSLITALILFEFGTGVVKGLAFTLAIGIGISLFTAIFVVKTLVEVFNIGNYKEAGK